MRCKKAETMILRSLDGRLDARAAGELEEHLRTCASCRKAEAEYRTMMSLLKTGKEEAPLPRFWERLEPRLKEEQKVVPLVLWERWALHAVPVFVAVVVLAAGLFVFTPQTRELSQSEALLMENTNPFSETRRLFEANRPEDKSMMLIFASLDEKPAVRSQRP
ncbi:MAG: zf-HC2 domain-containing protein [Acidobacteriota bacterium]